MVVEADIEIPPGTYRPTAKQHLLWQYIHDAEPGSLTLLGYGGAAGGGKTRAMAELALDLMLTYPGNRGMIGRKDFSDLRTTTLEEFDKQFALLPLSIRRSRDSSPVSRLLRLPEWPKGVWSTVHFRELKDYLSLGSEEYGFAMIDEAGEVPEQSMLMLLSRMRHQAARKRVIACGSNPWPGWFQRWFVRRELPEDVIREVGGRVHFIPALMRDNPHLPDNYESLLRAIYPADWVNRFVEGRWDAFVGQVYDNLTMQHCWYGPLPHFERLVGGLDFGGQNPQAHMTAAVVAGLTHENHLIRFAHFEATGAGVYEQLIDWMGVIQRLYGRVDWRGDRTQMFGIDQLRRSGAFSINESHGGADSVVTGIGLVKRRFEDKTSWFTEDLLAAPSPGAQSWYRRMIEYRWPENSDPDKPVQVNPIKRDDDSVDADRYMAEEADGFPSRRATSTMYGEVRR